jgi:hypothetical protein
LHVRVQSGSQRIDALLQAVTVIDVITVAEQRAFFALATDFAAPGDLGLARGIAAGLTIDLALQIGVDLT